jgi:hypothetical protein
MAILPIVTYDDPVLRKPAEPVRSDYPGIDALIRGMTFGDYGRGAYSSLSLDQWREIQERLRDKAQQRLEETAKKVGASSPAKTLVGEGEPAEAVAAEVIVFFLIGPALLIRIGARGVLRDVHHAQALARGEAHSILRRLQHTVEGPVLRILPDG